MYLALVAAWFYTHFIYLLSKINTSQSSVLWGWFVHSCIFRYLMEYRLKTYSRYQNCHYSFLSSSVCLSSLETSKQTNKSCNLFCLYAEMFVKSPVLDASQLLPIYLQFFSFLFSFYFFFCQDTLVLSDVLWMRLLSVPSTKE